MESLWAFFLFTFGLCLGSFLNVVVDRLPKGESIFAGRSSCDHFKKTLAWYDLIPLLSFAWLRGKCRYCGKRISWQYPLVESGTGAVFVIGGIRLIGEGGGIREIGEAFYLLFICLSLIVIFLSDLRFQIIPDKIVYPSIVISFIYQIIYHTPEYGKYFLAGVLGGGFFYLLFFLTRGRGMGMGDVKLAGLMGLILGWPKIIIALYLAFLTGAIFAVILILSGKKKFGQRIPFGPFLVGGTFVAWFWGEEILGYLGRLGFLGT